MTDGNSHHSLPAWLPSPPDCHQHLCSLHPVQAPDRGPGACKVAQEAAGSGCKWLLHLLVPSLHSALGEVSAFDVSTAAALWQDGAHVMGCLCLGLLQQLPQPLPLCLHWQKCPAENFQSPSSALARVFGEEGFISHPISEANTPAEGGNLTVQTRSPPSSSGTKYINF